MWLKAVSERNVKLRTVLLESSASDVAALAAFSIRDSPFATQVAAWLDQFLSQAPVIFPHWHRLPVLTQQNYIFILHHKMSGLCYASTFRDTSLKLYEDYRTFARISLALSAQ